MPTGPDPSKFAGPKHIFSGHFHKRQTEGNITYIGNAFPSNFGDVGDFARGMATYDHTRNALSFIDWKDCPKYIRVKLSKMLGDQYELPAQARVKCVLDSELTFEDSSAVKEEFTKRFSLRELVLEEINDLDDALVNTTGIEGSTELEVGNINTVDQLVIQMLSEIKVDNIDEALLVQMYRDLG